MPWQKMLFRTDTVWVHVGDDGRPILDGDGRAEMKYRETDTKSYRPGPANLSPMQAGSDRGADPGARPAAAARKTDRKSETRRKSPRAGGGSGGGTGDGAIAVWTDGACSGNPGPMGIGVVVIDGAWREELGEYLGTGTNNIAELVAIERGLDLAGPRLAAGERAASVSVRVHSDSSYALGLLGKGWKAKANQELVARIRRKLSTFPAAIEFIKVQGHAGVEENERCDELARLAIETRAASR